MSMQYILNTEYPVHNWGSRRIRICTGACRWRRPRWPILEGHLLSFWGEIWCDVMYMYLYYATSGKGWPYTHKENSVDWPGRGLQFRYQIVWNSHRSGNRVSWGPSLFPTVHIVNQPSSFQTTSNVAPSLSPIHDSVSIPLVLGYLSYWRTADSKSPGDFGSLQSIFNFWRLIVLGYEIQR